MPQGPQRKRVCTVVAFMASVVSSGVVLADADPCVEAMNKIWSVNDATSFMAIESQIHALKVNSADVGTDHIKSFPDLGDC